ncbi:signal peptide peptidase SppA [Rhodohalobacter barkolensis]|uniref:Signal peptide peptidase SppA n=1 Tax=Rhodohalobacter barkolensis TaxID=2053187 RepID=A0A2N0VKS8_9BACT|nr:signal peptide peptidase SppA [Rhodohalobacter barkolensis]PKD44761.1 signal peptide peptidase SppA [Rhodohalobacter barkolensis]
MQFFKTFLASILGTILGVLILVLILFATLVSSSSEPEPYIRSNTVLTMNISGDIPTRVSDDPIEELFNPGATHRMSLQNLKSNLDKAAADDNIQAVWVKTNQVLASWANLETAYRYFEEFKESGKPIYFSTDDIGMNEKSYYLASLADSIFTPPVTNFEFDGFVAQFTFYSDMLDKIGIEPEIFRVGKYKSAVEPYINESSSPESREQTREILGTATNTFVEAVAKRTGKSNEEVDELLNSAPIERVEFAIENGLIDAYAYVDEVEEIIKERLEVDEDTELQTVGFSRYSRVTANSAGLDLPDTSDRIAVIYSSGIILPDLGDSPFGSAGITPKKFKNQLDSAVEDDNVKAIVVHIDSPGGSATSSDLLWHYIKQATEKKPVIASMGTVAASGGYYMAMGADTVLAGENTITGSIGIFNLLFNAEELVSDKIGIDYETLKTHEYADLLNLTRPFTPAERRIIQQNVESGYETFLQRVAEARGMTRDETHEVAQGRVYTGVAALNAGLIDEVGDLDRAIEVAAEMAEIDTYRIDTYPKKEDIFEALFSSSNAKIQSMMTSWVPNNLLEEARTVQFYMNQPNGQNWMLLPIQFEVN